MNKTWVVILETKRPKKTQILAFKSKELADKCRDHVIENVNKKPFEMAMRTIVVDPEQVESKEAYFEL